MKICNRCKLTKNEEEFFNDNNTKDGKCPSCKECVYERRKNPKKSLAVTTTHKQCSLCLEIKANDDFYRDSAKYSSNGRHSMCRKCKDAATYKWREQNKKHYNEMCRVSNKKRYPEARLARYGLTNEWFVKTLEAQGGVCAIPGCGKKATSKRTLAVDHEHYSNKVRGILCYKCNRDMNVVDDEAHLAKLIEYKKRYA